MKLGIALLAGFVSVASLSAQRADPRAIEMANLREDVRLLQQTVAELQSSVAQLQRDNAALSSQAESGRAAYATLAQVNDALAQLKQAVDASLAEQKRETLQTVAQQISKLAKDTNAAIAAVAKGQATRPTIATEFTDDFPKEGVTHTVQAGETLSIIAKKYGVPMKNIQNANRIADPTKLHVGQSLFIPGSTGPIMPPPQVRPQN
ncbi:MAG TPA: LysM peptidoglycan-binding domain-containing protein [Opitutaceae bacterium]|nr:LysM peptidoglycan-binding domain-containing protein [Opitutaceae bacterium]